MHQIQLITKNKNGDKNYCAIFIFNKIIKNFKIV